MPYARSRDGTRIHFQTCGAGERWAVLIQGLGMASAHWVDQPELLAAAGFRVLTVDNRGAGQSERVRRPYSIARMAEDVVAAMDAVGARRAAVAGISMGGMIVQELALCFPERVEALLLLATSPGLPHASLPTARALSLLTRIPMLHSRGQAAEAYRTLFFGTRPDSEALPLLEKLMQSWGRLDPALRAGPADFALQFQAAVRHSTGSRLSALRMPVHVVCGADDVVMPARNAQAFSRLLRQGSVELLPRTGHAVPLEHPRLIASSLSRLVAGSEPEP